MKFDKNRQREGERFLALPHGVLDSAAFRGLSAYAKALLIDIGRQYMGSNNGALLCSRRKMAEYGWKSADTLTKAKQELLDANLLFQTVQGHRPNKASWYALTWRALDKLDGLDAGSAALFRQGAYRDKALASAKPTRDELVRRWEAPKATPKTQALSRHTEQEGD